ncbi:hypothetical protein N0V83_006918 [Neocucurbitaria cava]|uniref:Uncharacterized protein n=1 Tax=Neocucurbitaria cava TaxID=798079 RepID=A0A9W8Y3Z8_9PLEO|nr:hypothetical protein N0V83_006918 [Neocucurbitaria cava]
MAPIRYKELDEAQARVEQELSRVIFCRDEEQRELRRRLAYPAPTALKSYNNQISQLYGAISNYTHVANMTTVVRVLELPREIRDTIYMHLWHSGRDQDFRRLLLYWWELFDQPWVITGIHPIGAPLTTVATDLRPPHFVDQAFVGPHFAREVLVQLHDTLGKDLRPCDWNPISEFSLIDTSVEAFVRKDTFGVGKTMEELVRNLDLRVVFQCDVLDDFDEEKSGVEEEEIADRMPHQSSGEIARQKYLAQLEENVRALIEIPYTNRITIHDGQTKCLSSRPRIITLVIRQESTIDLTKSLVPILRLVALAHEGTKKTGFTVKVQYHSDEIGLKVLFEEDAWNWSGADWNANLKRKNTSKVDEEEWDLQKQASAWEHIQKILFNLEVART